MRAPRLSDDPVGTGHPSARCCWCTSPLVIAEVGSPALRCWVCPQCYARQVQYAVIQVLKGKRRYFHVPLPSQVAVYEASSAGGYLLWGGQAGPGKSTGGRWFLYWRSLLVPGHESLLLRENWDQLRDNHTLRMAVEVPQLGGRWLESDRLAVFGKGSDQALIHCGHMADAAALGRYIGIEYGVILADEAVLYPVDGDGVPVLAELSTRARKMYVDRSGGLVPGLFLPVSNPGGPSAPWLRDMHIDHTPDFEKYPRLRPVFDEATGEQIEGYRAEQWRYHPAPLAENPYMRPDYRQTQLAVLSATRYKQLAEANWDAFAGQFFPAWDEQYHVRRAVVAA